MTYKMRFSNNFRKNFYSLPTDIQGRIRGMIEKLKESPLSGKPLGFKFFREKKIEGYRFYYLVYEEVLCVFAVAISQKKDQQITISLIKQNLSKYKDELLDMLKSIKEPL